MSLIFKNKNRGFTLIELLVVIAIIGVLASVVLASLNSARIKGQEAFIKSTLKNISTQAEMAYDVPGNYSTVCTDTKIVSMMDSLTNSGFTSKCFSLDNLRWGVSTKNSDGSKNWSVSSSGVVIWNTSNSGYITWANATTACTALGGRLPSVEEFRALYISYGGVPTGFLTNTYWTSTSDPTDNNNAYYVVSGGLSAVSSSKTGAFWAQCVK